MENTEAVQAFLDAIEREGLGMRALQGATASMGRTALVADASFGAHARATGLEARTLEDAGQPALREFDSVVVAAISLAEELASRDVARRAHPGKQVLGFVWDIFLNRLARRPPPWEDPEPDPSLPPNKLAILTLPRSGSTMLAGMLSECGIGRCEEHLRWPLIHLLRRERALECTIVERLMRIAARDDWFSTKLISHFMFELEKTLGDGTIFRFLEDNSFQCIYLRREDKVLQTVSAFVATRTGSFHSHLIDPETYRYPPYDFEGMRHIFESFRRQEARLAKLADQLSSCRTVVYEDFCRDRTGGMQSILAGLGHSGTPVAEPSIARMPRGEALDFAERFRADYRDKLGAEPVG